MLRLKSPKHRRPKALESRLIHSSTPTICCSSGRQVDNSPQLILKKRENMTTIGKEIVRTSGLFKGMHLLTIHVSLNESNRTNINPNILYHTCTLKTAK